MPVDQEPRLTELFQDAFSRIQEIIRSEMRLAKAETREELGKAVKAGAVVGGGGVLSLYAFGLLLLAGVTALAVVVPLWLAFLLIGALTGITAAAMIGAGRHQLRRVHVRPERTISTVRENLEWARQQSK